MTRTLGVGILALSLFTGCNKDNCKGEEAKIINMQLDGCGMLIELGDGKKIEPVNLDEFDIKPEDGQKIWVKYHQIDAASACMAGKIVEIDCISIRD